jgi:N-formylglutamate amidohydrolase
MNHSAYTLHLPESRTSPVVFSSPHSGTEYTEAFKAQSRLDAQSLRSSEDAFVDRLFADAPNFGAPLLAAKGPRAYIDMNRGPDELDAALIENVPHVSHNPRIHSGLGVIPRVVSAGRSIYHGRIPRAEAEARIARHWHPYHNRLRQLLEESHQLFGQAILIDCHSMPHEALENHSRAGSPLPEIVIGDRFGAAAARPLVDQIEAAFSAVGLRVARNTPFAGAYIAQTYGRPSRQQHAIQIEIDRSLYMNEATIEPRPDFAAFQQVLAGVTAEIAQIGATRLPLAAE